MQIFLDVHKRIYLLVKIWELCIFIKVKILTSHLCFYIQNILRTCEGKQVFSDRKKIWIVTALDVIKCLNNRDCSLRAHLYLSYHYNFRTMANPFNNLIQKPWLKWSLAHLFLEFRAKIRRKGQPRTRRHREDINIKSQI